MSRREDLAESIRQSYQLVRDFEEQVCLSDEPKERVRAERDSTQQWDLIQGYWEEYLTLCRQGLAPADDIQQICAHFAPPADEWHIPLLVVVGKPEPAVDSNWQEVLQAMEAWDFAPEHFQRDFGVGRSELLLYQADPLPNDCPDTWIDFSRQFRYRLDQLCFRVPSQRTFHIFVNGPAALAVELGAAMGTLFQPVVYQYIPPKYYPVIDFYTLAKMTRRGIHFLEEPVPKEFRFVHLEGDPGDAPEVCVSLRLAGPDPREHMETLVRRQGEGGDQHSGTMHIARREERFLEPQDDWILCAREILTSLHQIVSAANRERVHLFLSAPVALAVALGLGLKCFRPLTVWNWSPPDQQYYPVLPLEKLGRTAP